VKPPLTIAEVISTMPEEERFILSLHYVNGMTTSYIATTLQVPEKAVISVVQAGKRRIFEALDFPPIV